VSAWTTRGAMVGHLCDLAAALSRRGYHVRALDVIEQARALALPHPVDPEADYREGLMAAGVPFDDIDAAVAAIARDEHPPTSLPGLLKSHRAEAEANTGAAVRARSAYWDGREACSRWVLELLGCEVPK